MAATVAASATTASTANATSHTVNLPSGIVSGSRLLMILCVDGDPTVTYTGGLAWSEVVNNSPSVAVRVILAYYDCDGSEGSTTTVTTSASQGIAAVVVRLEGHHSDAIEGGSTSGGGGLSVDPPSLSPTWGSEDTLFGTAMGYDVGGNTVSTWPTGFDENQLSIRWDNSNGTGAAIAFDTQTASSINPSQWSVTPTNCMKVGITFAIRTATATNYTLTADHGSFTLTGQSADLLVSRVLVAEQGSFTLTGQSAGLFASRIITADAGSFTLSGQDADLIKSTPGSYTLTADHGVFSLSGQAVDLIVSRVIVAEHGVYSLSGQDATLVYSGQELAVGCEFTAPAQRLHFTAVVDRLHFTASEQ